MKKTGIPALSFQMALAAMAITGIGLVTPRLTEAFAMTTSQQGVLVGVQYAGAVVACLIGGVFCARYGSAFFTRLLLAAGAAVMLFFGFVPDYTAALCGVFLIGVVIIGLENSIMASCLRLGDKAPFANSVVHTLFSVGAITAPLMFLFFSRLGGWRPVYYTLAALFFAAAVFSGGRPGPRGADSFAGLFSSYARYLSRPKCLLGALVLLLYVAAEVGLWSLMPTLVEATVGGSLSGVISSSLFWSMMLAGRALSTVLMRRVPRLFILLPFGAGGIVCYALLIFLSGPAAVASAALAGFFCAPFFAFLTSWSVELSGDSSPSYLSFVMAFGMAGPVALGWIVGALGDLVAGRLIILPALCCLVAMLALYAPPALREKSGRPATF